MRGRLRVPGDKSISHRAALLAALTSGGPVRIENYATSADCASTLACLQQLGIGIEQHDTTVTLAGAGLQLPHAPAAALDCGNSGTTLRLLAGLLAGQSFPATLTGDDSLRTRPMRRIIEPLAQMGAHVAAQAGRAPLTIKGRRPLNAIAYTPPVASAQVKSCVLLAGLNADGRTNVCEHTPTRDHTERLLRWFGVAVETESATVNGQSAHVVSLAPPAQLAARDCAIPGDISTAAFFFVAAALLPASDLTVANVGLNPTRTQIIATLSALGADVQVADVRAQMGEPVGDVRVRGGLTQAAAGANVLDGPLIAALIDELPILAVLGTQLAGGLTIRDAGELRVKETDRIRAMALNLRALGAEVEEYEDGLSVHGPAALVGTRLDAYGDHRIAMASAVAALIATGDSELVGADCVRISCPEFFALLEATLER
jgi:3-phosphoshikimate 1-carboxyvinyltransferase